MSFNATMLVLILGIVIGAVVRPGLLEIAIVAAGIYGVAQLGRAKRTLPER